MTTADAEVVAALHTASWRSAYRGVFTADWLDVHAGADRTAHWARRFATLAGREAGLVAEDGEGIAAFAYLIADAEPSRGTLLDNLHVQPDRRGGGLGASLMGASARLAIARSWPSGLHLWVFEANAMARGFYERLGGEIVERVLYDAADGGAHPALCYHWNAKAAARLAGHAKVARGRA